MQTRLRGEEELDQSFKEMLAEFMSEMTPEQRLRGLPAEERLRGLTAAERRRLRELLDRSEPDSEP